MVGVECLRLPSLSQARLLPVAPREQVWEPEGDLGKGTARLDVITCPISSAPEEPWEDQAEICPNSQQIGHGSR